MSFLVRYLEASGKYKILNPTSDSVDINGVILGYGTNVVTVSGTNGLGLVSGALDAKINSVSGASSIRDDLQDALLTSVSGTLNAQILSVSGASSIRDDLQDALLSSVSGTLNAKINSVSGASSIRDDSQDAVTQSVSTNLQGQINAITSDRAKEERFSVSAGQTVVGPLTQIVFDPSYTTRDLQAFYNGQKVYQSINGSLLGDVSASGDWEKFGADSIRFLYPLQEGTVVVRDERTGGGAVSGGGGSSTDLENITVNPAPDSNGGHSLGTNLRAWSGMFLRDTALPTNVYRVEIVSGALQATLV